MATETRAGPRLPQEVGKLTTGWWVFMALSGLLAAVGVVAYINEVNQGMVVTGMRNVGTMGGATWALYVSMVVYFIGVSFAGITVAAVIRIFNLEKVRSIARMAEVLTVVALVLGALAIVLDLGQPLRGIVNLLKYARPQSPFFGTFTLVITGYLFASLTYLYLGGRKDASICAQVPSSLRWYHRLWASGYGDTPEEQDRHRRTSFWLALAVLPLLVIAHSTLGFVFGLQVGRPGWYGTLQAPAFVVLAGVSGLGMLIILMAIVRKVVKSADRVHIDVFAWLGKFLMALLFVYIYFVIVELFTLIYATPEVEKRLSDALLSGQYAWIYWGSIATLVGGVGILTWQALTRRWLLGWTVAAGILANVGAVGKRFLIVVPSQTHGTLLPYDIGSYSPTLTEIAATLGLVGLGALLVALFIKTFPALPLTDEEVV